MDVDAMLQDLNKGLFERPLWNSFLTRFCNQTDAAYATLSFGMYRSENVIALCSGEGPPPEVPEQVLRARSRQSTPLQLIRGKESFSIDRFFQPDEIHERKAFWSKLHARGIEYVWIQPLIDPRGTAAWITCAGRSSGKETAREVLSQLAPHVRQAVRTYIALEQERFSSAIVLEAAQRLNFGWFMLDGECRIIDGTAPARRILADIPQMKKGSDGVLHFQSAAVARQVRDIVGRFASDTTGTPRTFILCREPWIELILAPVQQRPIVSSSPPVAVAYVRADRLTQSDRVEQLIALFGLSPREAQFAWALTQGMSIAQAANKMRIATETARGYSKKIYSKIGARGQADLVRIILISILAIV